MAQVTADKPRDKLSEEEISKQTENEKQKDIVEEKQVEHQHGEKPYVFMTAVGVTSEVQAEIKQQYEKHRKEGPAVSNHSVIREPEEDENFAEGIINTSSEIDKHRARGSGERQYTDTQVIEACEAITEFTVNTAAGFTANTLDEIVNDVVVDNLATKFDGALKSLFGVPVAQQTPEQLIITFTKMASFTKTVIDLCKKCWDSVPTVYIAVAVIVVGTALYKVANKYGLNAWVQSKGGWCGLYSRVRDYIRRLTGQISDSSTTTTDHDGQENPPSIPWPSNNTVILFGALTVFVGFYTHYKFRSS